MSGVACEGVARRRQTQLAFVAQNFSKSTFYAFLSRPPARWARRPSSERTVSTSSITSPRSRATAPAPLSSSSSSTRSMSSSAAPARASTCAPPLVAGCKSRASVRAALRGRRSSCLVPPCAISPPLGHAADDASALPPSELHPLSHALPQPRSPPPLLFPAPSPYRSRPFSCLLRLATPRLCSPQTCPCRV